MIEECEGVQGTLKWVASINYRAKLDLEYADFRVFLGDLCGIFNEKSGFQSAGFLVQSSLPLSRLSAMTVAGLHD